MSPLRTGLAVTVTSPSIPSVPSPGGEGQGEGGISSSVSPPILDFISSDETLDRYQEIISPTGWKLGCYLRNPVFQNAHQHGDILHTLGKALITEVRSIAGRHALFQRIEFAVEANPIARLAHKLYQGAFLRAVSVGFIPIRWEDAPPPVDGRGVKGESTCRRRYLEQELLEVSAVSIPANPNALALALKSGAIEKSDLRDLVDVCSLTLSTLARPHIPSPQFLSLARLASTLLKR